ncbi:uncharacterized protein EV154DRAFT_531486, partial [Mucor mucedo]|uniref:uncharacterized protein n=1 Tax=Mucor mucedo TaxID=29922 RepID=UPI0022211D54
MKEETSIGTESATLIKKLWDQIDDLNQRNKTDIACVIVKVRAVYFDFYDYLERVDATFTHKSKYINNLEKKTDVYKASRKFDIESIKEMKIEASLIPQIVIAHRKNGFEIIKEFGECRKQTEEQLKKLEDSKIRYVKFKEHKKSAGVGLTTGAVLLALGDAACTGGMLFASGLAAGGYASYKRSCKNKKVSDLFDLMRNMLENLDEQILQSNSVGVKLNSVGSTDAFLECLGKINRCYSENPGINNDGNRFDVLFDSMKKAIDEVKTKIDEIRKHVDMNRSSLKMIVETKITNI